MISSLQAWSAAGMSNWPFLELGVHEGDVRRRTVNGVSWLWWLFMDAASNWQRFTVWRIMDEMARERDHSADSTPNKMPQWDWLDLIRADSIGAGGEGGGYSSAGIVAVTAGFSSLPFSAWRWQALQPFQGAIAPFITCLLEQEATCDCRSLSHGPLECQNGFTIELGFLPYLLTISLSRSKAVVQNWRNNDYVNAREINGLRCAFILKVLPQVSGHRFYSPGVGVLSASKQC